MTVVCYNYAVASYLPCFHPETAGERFIGKNTGGQRMTHAQLMSRRKMLNEIRPRLLANGENMTHHHNLAQARAEAIWLAVNVNK